MNEQIIREQYRRLLNDINFDKIDVESKTPNIFNILGISRNEIRHSFFLAWLLNPNENHGLGKQFLIKFLREIASYNNAIELDELDIESLNFNSFEIRREWKNIDLLLIIDNLIVCIENKVDSQDHSEQLSRYRYIVKETFSTYKKVFVYLTPFGSDPNSISERQYYLNYSYEKIIDQLEKVIFVNKKTINIQNYQYIDDYITILKRVIMSNDNLNILANKIYKNHKSLFDFVFENKADYAYEIQTIIEKKLISEGYIIGSRNKGYVRFLTKTLNDVIPRKGLDWPQKENFLFEIDFLWNKKKANFKTVISPTETDIQNFLCEILEKIPGHKKPSGKKWKVHFHKDWNFNKEELIEVNESEILNSINSVWNEISDIINKVEIEMLKHKQKLLELC